MAELRGNAIVARSGGPTTVINASAGGVSQQCSRQDAFADIDGANLGIRGFLREDLDTADRHHQLGGVADARQHWIEREIGSKARYNKHGTNPRAASRFASHTDSDQAYPCGAEAVRPAIAAIRGWVATADRRPAAPPRPRANRAGLGRPRRAALPTHISDALRGYVAPPRCRARCRSG